MTSSDEAQHAWWPYVVPMAGFLLLTGLEDFLPKQGGKPHLTWYPLAYTAKIAIVTVLAWVGRAAWRDLFPLPGFRAIGLAVALGVAVTVAWVGLESIPYPKITMAGGQRQAFDPYALPLAKRLGFLTARLFGLVLLVPLIEELFWRSFLLRWVIDSDFRKVPIGQVTWGAAAITSGLFAVAHPEWLPAILTGAAWAWLLWQTKSLLACVISHAVANLGLGIYVLITHDWRFW